ncbi:MAG: sortase [Clostridiaceae bacterium]|jgi:sortase A|nr:sortase [Clostridiaceae bacterium]
MEKKEKRRISTVKILSIILILAGVLFIMIPAVKTYINTKRNDDIIDEFLRQADAAASNAQTLGDEEVEDFYIPPELSVNPEPTPNTIAPSETPVADEPVDSPPPTKKPGMSKEEMQKRTKGVLLIPKIDVKMLIMDGVDDDTLRVAAGRLPYTDDLDEVGNCVLAGHRSYTFGKYLNRLNELEIGDQITVQTKDKTLNYTIYKKLIIEPDDFSIIKGNGTDKILTVFTCDPPGIGSHRLVVHAKQD